MCCVCHQKISGYYNRMMTLNALLIDTPTIGKNHFNFDACKTVQSHTLIPSSPFFKLSRNGFNQLPVILFSAITDWRITPECYVKWLFSCKETTIESVSSCYFEVFSSFSLHVIDNPLPSKPKLLKSNSWIGNMDELPGAPRSFNACLRSTEKREKITPSVYAG